MNLFLKKTCSITYNDHRQTNAPTFNFLHVKVVGIPRWNFSCITETTVTHTIRSCCNLAVKKPSLAWEAQELHSQPRLAQTLHSKTRLATQGLQNHARLAQPPPGFTINLVHSALLPLPSSFPTMQNIRDLSKGKADLPF